MGRFQRLGDLLGDGQGLVDWDKALGDTLRQRRPVDQFEDERLDPVDLSDVRSPG